MGPGTLIPRVPWTPITCLSPTKLWLQSWVQPWLLYSGTPWTDWLQQLRNCALPGAGKFEPSLEVAPAPCAKCRNDKTWFPQGQPRRRSKRFHSLGTWQTHTAWLPDTSAAERGYAWLSPAAVLSCLDGRILVFEGDSFVRQAFLRLIWWLRGVTHLVEHFFHRHAIYTLNASSDELAIIGNVTLRPYTLPRDKAAERDIIEKLFRATGAHRRSGSLGSRTAWIVYRYAGRPVDVEAMSIGAPRYWRPVYGRLAGIVSGHSGRFVVRWRAAGASPACGQAPVNLQQDRGPRSWPNETLDIDAINAAGGAAHFYRRNRLCVAAKTPTSSREPTTDSKASGARDADGPCSLDGDTMLGLSGQRQFGHRIPRGMRFRHLSHQDAHFDCSLLDEWPATAVSGWKQPENGDCRGVLSLNVVQAVLNRIGCTPAGGC